MNEVLEAPLLNSEVITSQIHELKSSFCYIQFMGYIVSARNLGNVVFLILQDHVGFIQGILQKEHLDRKVLSFLPGKKVKILGNVRKREQARKSKNDINPNFEIDIQQIFLQDLNANFIPLIQDGNTVKTEQNIINLEVRIKHKNFDRITQFAKLISSLRRYLVSSDYIELERGFFEIHKISKESNQKFQLFTDSGFDRHFQLENRLGNTHVPLLTLSLVMTSTESRTFFVCVMELVNAVLQHFNAKQIANFDVMSEEEAYFSFGNFIPDLRLPLKIINLSGISHFKDIKLFNQYNISVLSCTIEKQGLLQIEKIKQFVLLKTGLKLTPLWVLNNFQTHGLLQELLPPECIAEIIKITRATEGSVLLFAIEKEANLSNLSLGTALEYVATHNLYALEGMKALWISAKDATSVSYPNSKRAKHRLIMNGVEIGQGEELNNNVSLSLDLYTLSMMAQDQKNHTFKKQPILSVLENLVSPENDDLTIPLSISQIVEEIEHVQQREKEELNALIVETHSSETEKDKLQRLSKVLADFAMDFDTASKLFILLPQEFQRVLSEEGHEIFKLLWSLLGHKHVIEMIHSKEAYETMHQVCRLSIITDYRQILFLRSHGLHLISLLFNENGKENGTGNFNMIKSLKAILCGAPNEFLNFVTCLFIEFHKEPSLNSRMHEYFFRAVKFGLSTPLFFEFFLENQNDTNALQSFICCIKSVSYLIFPNRKIEKNEILDAFFNLLASEKIIFKEGNSNQLFIEIIYFLFKPLNMDLDSMKFFLHYLRDGTEVFKQHGIRFSGNHWDEIEKCYYFHSYLNSNKKQFLKIFPSKNVASFFAKASSGICTGIDINLFHRDDHFHLNMVIPEEERVVGNVQAYIFENEKKRIMFIRGINPSAAFLTQDNVLFILQSVLIASIEISKASNFDELLICPSLGIWHVESSRMEMIAALSLLCKKLPVVTLQEPLFLFHFANQDKSIKYGYKLWSKGNERQWCT